MNLALSAALLGGAIIDLDGTFFLQLDALERGERWRFPQPDTPFAG